MPVVTRREDFDAVLDLRVRSGGVGRFGGWCLKILYVSAEVAPFAKVGGLADVAGSLPKALKAMGHDVRIAMPSYRMIEENPAYRVEDVPLDRELVVALNPIWHKEAYVKRTAIEDVPVYLLGTDEWFNETVNSQTIYIPGCDQYLFFSKGILEMLRALDWIPDVIHCNDWQTGLIPVLMRESREPLWDRVATTYTIHNLAYQGEFGYEVLERVGLPPHLYNMHQLETFGSVNFLKAGAVYSDLVNTVSPRYAEEIQTAEFGCRLHGLMEHLHEENRLRGILNGIDTDFFNPETDPHLPANYSVDSLEGKGQCKSKLLQELGMPEIEGVPLMGVVSRLSSQKGMDLILDSAESLFELPAQMVIQGLGDPWLATKFSELQAKYPESFRFVERFDADLAQRVYAGSDIFLMPSAFEPCGLGQMIALRYGTIPVVRQTGGLANTVFEGENGFVFEERQAQDFFEAAERSVLAYRQASDWRQLVQRAMSGDYSWSASAKQYVRMYESAIKMRKVASGQSSQ
jgi:starch synthase